jgi:hypothetical protein
MRREKSSLAPPRHAPTQGECFSSGGYRTGTMENIFVTWQIRRIMLSNRRQCYVTKFRGFFCERFYEDEGFMNHDVYSTTVKLAWNIHQFIANHYDKDVFCYDKFCLRIFILT